MTLLLISTVACAFGIFLTKLYTMYSPTGDISIINSFNKTDELKTQAEGMRSGLEKTGIQDIPLIGDLSVMLVGIANTILGMFSIVDIIGNLLDAAITIYPVLAWVFGIAGIAVSIWVGWEIMAWLRGWKS